MRALPHTIKHDSLSEAQYRLSVLDNGLTLVTMHALFNFLRLLSCRRWFACFLLLQVAGIGQLYPYVHLHHVHDDEGARVVISVHPPSAGEEHVDATSEDEHHHDTDHVTLDCNFCQRLLKQLQRSADVIVYQAKSTESIVQEVVVLCSLDPPPLVVSRPVSPTDFRGPPAIA